MTLDIESGPVTDLGPRIVSLDPQDFPVPNGREEEYRFLAIESVLPFMEPRAGAGAVVADDATLAKHASTGLVRNVPMAEVTSQWVPTDRASAVARQQATQAVVVDIPREQVLGEAVVVRLTTKQADGSAARQGYLHAEVVAGAFAKATVVIEHDASADVVGAVVVTLGEGADLTVVNVLDGDVPEQHTHLLRVPVRVGRDAKLTGGQVTLVGGTVRVLPSVVYDGPGGAAELLGIYLLEGKQYVEHRIFVDHDQPNCQSNVVYKGALSGTGAHSVWVGDVLVRRTATGIDTYEVNRNLLLDDGPRADSVPNLELETGDINSAGHASATGRFDDEQLFYLQSRGIPEDIARQLVVRGFFADVLGRMGAASAHEEWRDTLMARISARLGVPMDDDELVGADV